MAVTYALTIAGATKQIQPGWSHEATANGRDVFQAAVKSVDGSYRPALDAVVAFVEGVTINVSFAAAATVVQTTEPHGAVVGQTVQIVGHTGSTPALDGVYTVLVLYGPSQFSIAFTTSVGGTGGIAYRRIFGGTITKPSEAGVGGLGLEPILTTIDCDDFNAKAERRYVNEVLAAGTLKSMLTTIAANYGFTLHSAQVDGPSLALLPCDYALLSDVLEQLSVLTGYLWEFDEFDRLRMFLPGTEVAPINVVDGDGHAIGDITVEPTRTNYANRVILRFSAQARTSYGFLSTTLNFDDGNTVKLGATTYTFKDTIGDTTGNVKIGATAAISLANLVAAITLGAGAGTAYTAATTVNSSATAYIMTGYNTDVYGPNLMKAIALAPGAAGNSTATEETSNATWMNEGAVPAGTLLNGADQELTNVTIAEDTGEQTAHGIWEVVIQSPETIDAVAAATLAAAYLAVHLPVPRTVRYTTRALGMRPGQTHTITIADRAVNNTFLITDVSTQHIAKDLILRTVTAIESLLLQSADRWRDTYELWSSGSSSGATIAGGSGSGTVISITGGVYFFGGSQTEWQQTTAGGWIAANSVQVRLDTIARGSTAGTVYARIRAAAGSVTARLRNVSDSVTVGTSVAVTNTAYETVAFSVSLTPGSKLYAVELSPSISATDVNLGSSYLE